MMVIKLNNTFKIVITACFIAHFCNIRFINFILQNDSKRKSFPSGGRLG